MRDLAGPPSRIRGAGVGSVADLPRVSPVSCAPRRARQGGLGWRDSRRGPGGERARRALGRAARTARSGVVRIDGNDIRDTEQEGLAGTVGESGRAPSGGGRQRLSIARALLKASPILILDEATSALDADTEAKLVRALGAVTKGRTTFVIAHRLSTVRRGARIRVFDSGQIVEQATSNCSA